MEAKILEKYIRRLKRALLGGTPGTGICGLVYSEKGEKILWELVQKEYKTNCWAYSIPHPHKDPWIEYETTLWKWNPFTKYGRERRRFAKLLIKELESAYGKE